VKNFAKLVLFFSFSFIGILAFASALALLEEWAGQAALFPPPADPSGSGSFTGNLVLYLTSALPAAFYLSILLGQSYAARWRMAYPAVFCVMLVFSLVLSGGAFFGLESLKRMGGLSLTLKPPPADLAKPGFMLNPGSRVSGIETVFLTDPYEPWGPRVFQSFSGAEHSLGYQSRGIPFGQVRLPFMEEKSGLFDSIDRDLERSGGVFSAWFAEGFLAYGIYAGALGALLLSLGCLVNISFWSLANLFFAALAFRGALALENLLNQPNIHRLLASFAGGIVPESLINPLLFCALGALILLYSGLVYLARGRIADA
jgi:hypothetical protein